MEAGVQGFSETFSKSSTFNMQQARSNQMKERKEIPGGRNLGQGYHDKKVADYFSSKSSLCFLYVPQGVFQKCFPLLPFLFMYFTILQLYSANKKPYYVWRFASNARIEPPIYTVFWLAIHPCAK